MFCKQNFIERPGNLNIEKEKQYILQRKDAGVELSHVERSVLEALEEYPVYGKGGLASVFSGSPLSLAWNEFMEERTKVFQQCKNMEPGFQAIVDMGKIFNDLIGEEEVLEVFANVAKVAQLPDEQISWLQYVTPEGVVLTKEDFIERYNKE